MSEKNIIRDRFEIAPKSAKAFQVQAGDLLRIIDIKGGQPGDFVAFNSKNLEERFGQARTRVENGVYAIQAGDTLWTGNNPPCIMFSLTENTCGRHDLLYPPCNRYALEKRFSVDGDGCLENLLSALRPWKIKDSLLPEPLNLFFSVEVGEDCKIHLGEHYSSAGDRIEMRAEMDALVAISTCSAPIKGRDYSHYQIEIEKR